MNASQPDNTFSAITFASMRADIARMLHESPEEIEADDSLIDLGLDSIRAMTLVTRWREQGAELAFSELAEKPTLSHWWALAQQAMARRAPGEPQR